MKKRAIIPDIVVWINEYMIASTIVLLLASLRECCGVVVGWTKEPRNEFPGLL
ncbi:MAG: hypothetical protein NTW08_01380 [Gammaproteobacteria bacterium]|nr:hypothetical protein [Gammaproteobacteria bacterium]